MKVNLCLLLAGLLLGAAGCAKDKNLPYYQFTAEDRQWLTAKNGDTWVFENPAGRRIRFQLYNVAQRKETFTEAGNFRSRDYYHYDRFSAAIARLDTTMPSLSHLHFERRLPDEANYKKVRKEGSQLLLDCFWDGYLGNPAATAQNRMNFPAADEAESLFRTLTVRNRTYARVLELRADGDCANCFIPGGIAYKELYYDQQAGIVRMVTRAGVVWDRVP